MNSIELSLVELLQDAETPLYSAYRWLDKQFDDRMSLTAFLEMVEDLLERDVVRLWHVDLDTYEGERLLTVPLGLDDEYRALPELEDSWDPFGLSLTTGTAAPVREQSDWVFDIDFKLGCFAMSARAEAVEDAYEQMARHFSPARLIERRRRPEGSRVRIEGDVVDARHP